MTITASNPDLQESELAAASLSAVSGVMAGQGPATATAR
jgi:hypothetical protein